MLLRSTAAERLSFRLTRTVCPRRVGTLAALAVSIACAPFAAGAQAQPPGDVPAFAGVAYLTANADIEKLYPLTHAVEKLSADRGQPLTALLYEALQREGVPVSLALQQRTGTVTALAFDGEHITSEQLSDAWRVVVGVSAQALVVDFDDQTVVGSFPLQFEWVDVTPSRPDSNYFRGVPTALASAMLSKGQGSFLSIAARAFHVMPVAATAVCRIRVGSVSADSSLRAVAPSALDDPPERLLRVVAETFGRSWVTNSGQPLLPFGKSQAVNGKMPARFTDGRMFDLTVPEPDFEVALEGVRTRRQMLATTVAERADAVGTFMHVRVSEPLTNATIAEGEFKDVVADRVPARQLTVDAWPPVLAALQSLSAGLASATRTRDSGWFEKHTVSGGHAVQTSLTDWFTRCVSHS